MEALELDSRQKLYNEISKNPGLHFREIQRRSGMAIGALQYHLDYLEKHSLVKSQKVDNTKRYYALQVKRLEGVEKIMPLLRQEKSRHVMIALLTRKRPTIQGISRLTGIPYSSASRILDKLVENEIVEKKRTRKQIRYLVKQPEQIAKILIKYRKGFFDSLVDEFVIVWKELEIAGK